MHGWIILDKPLGLGSTSAVGAVKRLFREGGHGKVKIGHGGTLDPLATGVLPIALGEATKLAGRMLDSDKSYDFTVQFGTETRTLDAEGEVIATSEVRPTSAALCSVLARFIGTIEQVPPAFSALKVEGRRAYDLARAGEDVTLATRRITVSQLQTSQLEDEGTPLEQVTLSALVSKGTYIRSLARDIALALGTVGHVTMLRRTRAGPFDLRDAIMLDKLREIATSGGLSGVLRPIEAALDGIPALALTPEQAAYLRQGCVLERVAALDGVALAKMGNVPVALVEILDGTVRVQRGFNLDTAKDDK